MRKSITIYPISENALTVCLGNELDAAINDKVFSLYNGLRKQNNPFWKDLIPAYCTLTVVYDVREIRRHNPSAYDWVKKMLEEAINRCDDAESVSCRKLFIPVCYDLVFGLDLKTLAKTKKLSIDQVVELHTAQAYRVFMLGFLPGFAYMGIVHKKIATPRLSTPRQHVPTGSVGIAGSQTGIYPLDSPGGWNIIGRTPIKLFDAHAENPVLFQPGDEVEFYPITKDSFDSFDEKNFNPLSK